MPSRRIAPSLLAFAATVLLALGGSVVIGEQLRGAVSDDALSCDAICGNMSTEEHVLCLSSCNQANGNPAGSSSRATAQQSSQALWRQASSSSRQTFPLMQDFPASSVSTAGSQGNACAAAPFRQQTTRFCILAGSCWDEKLRAHGFVPDKTCTVRVDMTGLYRARRMGAASSLDDVPQAPSIIDIAAQAITIVDAILNRIPAGNAARAVVEDIRTYLGVLQSSAAARPLTQLETDATIQYLRQRLMDVKLALAQAHIPLDDQQAQHTERRRSIVEGTSTVLYTLLPEFFEQMTAANVPGLDVSAARNFHSTALHQFDAAKAACTGDPLSDSCSENLSTVFATLDSLEQLVRPPLESAGRWDDVESILTLDNAGQPAAPSDGFPKPTLGN